MHRTSVEYRNGVESFLNYAFTNAGGSKLILCPCNKCKVGHNRYFTRDVVAHHLMFNGFWPDYKEWVHHEGLTFEPLSSFFPSKGQNANSSEVESGFGEIDTMRILNDLFGINNADIIGDDSGVPIFHHDDVGDEECNGDLSSGDQRIEQGVISTVDDDVVYERLLEQAEQELYEGSKCSKLSFLLHLFHLKCMYGWSIKSFDMLLQLLGTIFPQINPLPSSWSKCKQLLKDLGLEYEKIHACPNDCILYWGGREKQESCDKCHASRWKDVERKLPAKVLRYFPLIPRLRRFYKSSKIAEDMIWHDRHRMKDGVLRHPADGKAWEKFDQQYSDFALDPRNVRLGLASDGFNPFRVMSSTHSTWPVLLIPYNLPPWLCMKQSLIILSMIIPREKAPGMDIDVYLQPLVKELLQLWNGVDAYDAYTRKRFTCVQLFTQLQVTSLLMLIYRGGVHRWIRKFCN